MRKHQRKFKSTICSLIVVCLIIAPSISFAQSDTPQDGCDPYDGCPLDTWVVVLAVIAVLIAVFQINKQSTNTSNALKSDG